MAFKSSRQKRRDDSYGTKIRRVDYTRLGERDFGLVNPFGV